MACTCGKQDWVVEEGLRDPLYEEIIVSDNEDNRERKEYRKIGANVMYIESCRSCSGVNRTWNEVE